MRSIGYAKQTNREGEVSYVRRVSGFDFPRFHVYVQDLAVPLTLSIHIDQKAPTYDGSSAHSGEYFGDVIEDELARMRAELGVPMVILVNKNGKPLER